MNSHAASTWKSWIGEWLLEHCAWHSPACQARCLAAPLCKAAQAHQNSGLWFGLVAEDRREGGLYALLILASLVLVLVCLLWPFWR